MGLSVSFAERESDAAGPFEQKNVEWAPLNGPLNGFSSGQALKPAIGAGNPDIPQQGTHAMPHGTVAYGASRQGRDDEPHLYRAVDGHLERVDGVRWVIARVERINGIEQRASLLVRQESPR